MFCVAEDFNKYPYNIADAEGDDTDLLTFIDTHEEELLVEILGRPFYEDLVANIADEPYVTLVAGGSYINLQGRKKYWNSFKEMLVPIIYSKWLEKDVQQAGVSGLESTTLENSGAVSPATKISSSWNSSYEMVCFMFGYIRAHPTIFDPLAVTFGYETMEQYVWGETEELGNKNEWSI